MHNNIFVQIRDLLNTTFLIMFVYNKNMISIIMSLKIGNFTQN